MESNVNMYFELTSLISKYGTVCMEYGKYNDCEVTMKKIYTELCEKLAKIFI